ncbi:MAG: hypothetical protein KDA21_13960 [Phycisphaerales bacterium]|nr:hypothetical protein [Phycisphaerales bacterium]
MQRVVPVSCAMAAACVSAAYAASPEYQNFISTAAPILWYSFNEASGDALNHGSLGAPFDGACSANVMRGVSTAGGDDASGFLNATAYVTSGGVSPLTGNPTFSIEALIRLKQPPVGNQWGPFLHWGSGLTGREVYFSIASNLNDRVYAGFYNAGLRTQASVPVNEWIHVVWVRTGGSGSNTGTTLYINGSAVAMEVDPQLNPGILTAGQINVAATHFSVNRAADFLGSRYFSGDIDELALYDRALDLSEITDHADAALLPPCPGDANGDRTVNFTDLNILLEAWNTSIPPGSGPDFDGNGTVNFTDLNILLDHWGDAC